MNFFRPVDTSILNEKKLAPIHLATELNKVKALEVMGKYKHVIDIQQGKKELSFKKDMHCKKGVHCRIFLLGGEHGRTALHVAAMHGKHEKKKKNF